MLLLLRSQDRRGRLSVHKLLILLKGTVDGEIGSRQIRVSQWTGRAPNYLNHVLQMPSFIFNNVGFIKGFSLV